MDDNTKAEAQNKEMGSSFSGCASYSKALAQTPKRLKERVGATWTPAEEMTQIRQRSGAYMQRKLEWYDLVAMGVGGMLGAGVFVTTGLVARETSGPAVVLSYVVAGVSALLSAFCYTEFAVEMPVAGGAFSYLRITFGEFAGYFAGANLLMEYVLSNAAVARSFTSYLPSVFGIVHKDAWRIKAHGLAEGYNMLDFPALALVILLTICLCHRLVIDWLNGKSNINNILLEHWCHRIRDLTALFEDIQFQHIYRSYNEEADSFSKMGLSGQTGILHIKELKEDKLMMEDCILLF